MEQRAKLVQFLCLTCGLQGMKECDAEEETETLLCSRCNSKVIFTKFSEGSVISNLTTAR
ncbi:MAG: hypothetical protein Q7I94_03020 [Candidatus Contubernalis sp.]|nr:hypothetical protein [Candidatus Contubernalis sp.]